MPIGQWFGLQGLMPNRDNPPSAVGAPLILPAGGPIGVGGWYTQGQAFTLTNNPAQPQIFTLTITTNGATGGNGYFVYYGDTNYSGLSIPGGGYAITANAITGWPTAAQLQAALITTVPTWSGNLTVTGATGGPYAITFNNLCATKSIGGLLQFVFQSSTGGNPTAAVTVAQQGSAGAGDVNVFNSATKNQVDGFLINSTLLDPVGGHNVDLAGDVGQAGAGEPCWIHGYFSADTTNTPEKSVVANWGASVPARITVTQGMWGTPTGLELLLQ